MRRRRILVCWRFLWEDSILTFANWIGKEKEIWKKKILYLLLNEFLVMGLILRFTENIGGIIFAGWQENRRDDSSAAWPVANPVFTCASVADAGYPSNFVADPFLYVQVLVLTLLDHGDNGVI